MFKIRILGYLLVLTTYFTFSVSSCLAKPIALLPESHQPILTSSQAARCDGSVSGFSDTLAKTPILISSQSDLENITSNNHYRLTADITLQNWYPILINASGSKVPKYLTNVVFDGNNKPTKQTGRQR